MTGGEIRVLIVDDEPRARRGVRMLLDDVGGVTVVGEAGCGEVAVAMINEQRPDLVFLDVQMPGLSGIDVLGQIDGETMPVVVFVTAYDQYALAAFECHAIDYLLKPIEDERFRRALDRARSLIAGKRAESRQRRLLDLLETWRSGDGVALPSAPRVAPPGGESVPTEFAAGGPGTADRIVLRSGGEILLLRPEEIDWIEADGDYMKYHVAGKSYLQRETMNALEGRLDAARFRRIHRSTIVALDRIVRMSSTFNGEYVVVLRDGTRLRMSKGYQSRLQEWLR